MHFKNYLYHFLALAVALVAIASALNILVDPYMIFGTPRLQGFNAVKPYAGARGRTAKIFQVERVQPSALISGNSRPEMGLDPLHPCWPERARPVYNIAIPGIGMEMQVQYARQAMRAGPVRLVVQGADFLDFLEYAVKPGQGGPPAGAVARDLPFSVGADGRSIPGVRWRRFKARWSAVLSNQALFDSIATIVRQSDAFAPTRTENGFHRAARLYLPIIRVEGVAALFHQKEEWMTKRLQMVRTTLGDMLAPEKGEFVALRGLLRAVNARGGETVLFINPYHAEYLLLIDKAGFWPLFEAWKRRLALLAREEGVALWDFSGFDAYSTEPLDSVAAKGEPLQWFWEPAHYRKEVGDIMLGNIFAASCPSGAKMPAFGVRLDSADIDARLARNRADRNAFIASHEEVWRRIARHYGEEAPSDQKGSR